jgi:type II secretory pathway component PulJ
MSSERGEFTLVGLLVAMVISFVVLGATLQVFEVFYSRNAEEVERADIEDRAHVAVDHLTRQLRNVAQPQRDSAGGHTTIERAGAADLIFKTVNSRRTQDAANPANIVRVRYCLDSSDRGNAKLYYQTALWVNNSAAPAATACPAAAGWATTALVADRISNFAGGQSRPIFTFDTSQLRGVETIHLKLFLDRDTTKTPGETQLSSGVFLRNQNRAPSPSFTATPNGTTIVLNASESSDPEGNPLKFQFYDIQAGTSTPIPSCANVVCTWTPGRTGDITIGLTVTDSGDIAIDAAPVTVTLP